MKEKAASVLKEGATATRSFSALEFSVDSKCEAKDRIVGWTDNGALHDGKLAPMLSPARLVRRRAAERPCGDVSGC